MTWVIWRQHRIELLITVLLLGAFLAGLVATGQVLAAGAFPGSSDFANLLESFMSAILIPMQFLPLLAGVFIGAPLVAREYESGTFNLAWTQGITRQRWLGMKLAWLGGGILVVFTLLALAGSWWNEPVNALLGPFRDFDAQGPVYVTYGLFALTLGGTAGIFLRKTVPAMALTIPIYLGVRFGIIALRQNFLAPLQDAWNMVGANPHARDWVLNQFFTNSAGSRLAEVTILQMCPTSFQRVKGVIDTCLQANGILQASMFQPASRFWTFQGIESAIFLALTAGMVLLTFWRLKRGVE